MEVLKLILENIDNIVTCVVILVTVAALIKKGETDVLKELLFGLITKAEQEFGEGTGLLKFSTVADWLYERIPTLIRPLFTSKNIEKLIEEALEKAKIEWKKNPDLIEINSISDLEITEAVEDAANVIIKKV